MRLLPITTCLLFLTSASAQVAQLRWDVQVDRPVPHDFPVWQGETVDLMPRLVQGTAPVAVTNSPVEFRYREAALAANVYRYVTAEPNTNTGVLAVRWIPDYDTGAAWYDYQIIVGSNAANPRAFGRITMRPTIGWPASTNAPPPVTLYPTRDDLQAISNALAEAVQTIGPRIDAVEAWPTNDWRAAHSWGDHAAAGYLASSLWLSWLDTNTYVQTESDPIALAALAAYRPDRMHARADPRKWIMLEFGTDTIIEYQLGDPVTNHTVTLSQDFEETVGHTRPAWATNVWPFSDEHWHGENAAGFAPPFVLSFRASLSRWIGTADAFPVTLVNVDDGLGTATVHRHIHYPTNEIARYPLLADPASLAALAAATNDLVQTYLLGSNAWMIVSNDVLRIWQVASTNAAQTNLLWQSGDAFPPAATQTLWSAIQQLTQDVADKGDKAWGQYAPDGSDNPDPAYMTWLNAPATVFASGAQWSTCGTYAVLTAPGTVAFASGGDGQFRIGPNSTNWFGYVQGGSVTVGAQPGAITVHAGGQAGGYAEIVYQYEDGDFPALWFTPSLSVDFVEVEGVVWVDNQDGTATVTAPAESPAGFWYATTTAIIDNYFASTMPARLAGGVVGATNALPVIYDSVITITSGGKTYRIPAQEVLP